MDKHLICRLMLRDVMQDVKALVPVQVRKAAWTYKYTFGQPTFEFHVNKCDGNDEEYHWYGHACCKWGARSKGWGRFLSERKLVCDDCGIHNPTDPHDCDPSRLEIGGTR